MRLEPIALESFDVNRSLDARAFVNATGAIQAHAPALLARRLPPRTRTILARFGFFPAAYESNRAEGATFTVDVAIADGTSLRLFTRDLNPNEVPADRGEHSFEVTLPVDAVNVELAIKPLPGRGVSYGWTCWRDLKFGVTQPADGPESQQ